MMRFSFASVATTVSKAEQEVSAVSEGPFVFHSTERGEACGPRSSPIAWLSSPRLMGNSKKVHCTKGQSLSLET